MLILLYLACERQKLTSLSSNDLTNQTQLNDHYTTFTNFSMKYHLMCKVYTDVGGIK